MSISSPTPPSGPNDPERLLRAQLRSTTPEFESRFDDLRRRLAHEPVPAQRQSGFASWLTARNVWAGAALAVCLAALFVYRSPRQAPLPRSEFVAYGELLALNETLRTALPLTDPETLDAVLELPAPPRS